MRIIGAYDKKLAQELLQELYNKSISGFLFEMVDKYGQTEWKQSKLNGVGGYIEFMDSKPMNIKKEFLNYLIITKNSQNV